eukprot:5464219-Alexandrium_andersonii.AAC.1
MPGAGQRGAQPRLFVVALGFRAQDSAERTPRELRVPMSRPLLGLSSASSEHLKPSLRVQMFGESYRGTAMALTTCPLLIAWLFAVITSWL